MASTTILTPLMHTVCEIDLSRDTVGLYWKRPDGAPYAYLSALP
jgi:uncharacterized protein YigE (DUF2233 family)